MFEGRAMRVEISTRRSNAYIAAFLAAGIFYLAGTICVVEAFSPRQAVPLFLGAMSFFVGSIWVVIGAKWKERS
jgi:hypothetical protein